MNSDPATAKAENPPSPRILVLGDSVVPGLPNQSLTGFGRVLLNLFERIAPGTSGGGVH